MHPGSKGSSEPQQCQYCKTRPESGLSIVPPVYTLSNFLFVSPDDIRHNKIRQSHLKLNKFQEELNHPSSQRDPKKLAKSATFYAYTPLLSTGWYQANDPLPLSVHDLEFIYHSHLKLLRRHIGIFGGEREPK